MATSFSDAVSARKLTTSHGTFGYLRLWTFDVEHITAFRRRVADLLRQMPRNGLIVDLRSNPGGVIDAAERLLQLFTPNRIEPARFACGPRRPWPDGGSRRQRRRPRRLGDLHAPRSRPRRGVLPAPAHQRPGRLQPLRRGYSGPVVAVVDANTFSCGDLFAAGIVDHGIGRIVSVGEATGAGGANVWTSDDIEFAYHAAGRQFPSPPAGISFSISVRRMIRTGNSPDSPSKTSASPATKPTQ